MKNKLLNQWQKIHPRSKWIPLWLGLMLFFLKFVIKGTVWCSFPFLFFFGMLILQIIWRVGAPDSPVTFNSNKYVD